MKKNLLVVFGILVFHTLFAHTELPLTSAEIRKIDSLKAKLAASRADTNRVKILNSLGWTYDAYRPVSAEPFFRKAMQLALKLDNKRLQSQSLRGLAIILMFKGRTPESLTHLFHALQISEDIQDKNEIGQNAKQIGVIYTLQKDYNKAKPYLWRSKDMLTTVGNDFDLSITLNCLGMVYETSHQDSALLYCNQSFELGVKTKMRFIIPNSLLTQGDVYTKKGNYPAALKYYRQSVRYNEPGATSQAYLSMATIFQKTGQSDSALFYGKLSFNTGGGKSKSDAGKFLSALYDGKDIAEAYKYLKIATQIADSMRLDEEALKIQNISFQEQQNKQEIEAAKAETRNRMRLYIFIGVLLSLLIIAVILFRNNRHKQRANELLKKQKQEIDKQKRKAEDALVNLKAAQKQLIQQEKMASLGEMTAGIAHEIQNPLNFVNNFSELGLELLDEAKTEISLGNNSDAASIVEETKENLKKVLHHGKRADAIVKNMLQHSRTTTGEKQPTDINALADEYLRLSYHGIKAKDTSFTAVLETHFDQTIGNIDVSPQEIGRVFLNLFNNAFYAVSQKKKNCDGQYEPMVSVSTRNRPESVEIVVGDNGTGIPEKTVEKIFQPFFTTKATGEGTGLGLSLSYDIITKGHGGEIKVESKEGEGSVFTLQLPLQP